VWVKLTRSRSGKETRTYVQLVESYWDRGQPRHRVVASLGRADGLDPKMVARLVRSLGRLTDQVAVVGGPEDVHSQGGKVYGSTYLLEELWRRLNLDRLWREAAMGRKFQFDLETAVRALVLSRLHNPTSERQTATWLARAHVTGAGELTLHQLYRALDVFYRLWPRLEPRLLPEIGQLIALDGRVYLFDTTSVSFEGGGPPGLAERGYSRDRRPDLKQFILGLLTTREGMPIGHVVLPGGHLGTPDSLRRAQEELLGRVPAAQPIIVLDRGMISAENLRALEAGGYKYIVGVRLRRHKARRALARPGRYARVAENLYVKEVQMPAGSERLIVCYNPLEARRDRESRASMVAQLQALVGKGEGIPRRLLRSASARRYLALRGGTVELDPERIRSDAVYDGKWVLATNVSRPHLPASEVARHYKGLWRVEHAFRTLKSPLETHPIFHWTERRVRAHVGICVLAYTLLRCLELLLEQAGLDISGQGALELLSRITRDEVRAGPVQFWVRSDLRPEQQALLQALRVGLPPKGERLGNPHPHSDRKTRRLG